MLIEDVIQTLDEFRSSGGIVHFRKTLDHSLVIQIENTIRAEFPSELRQFYMKFEYLQFGSQEIIWLRNLPEVCGSIQRQQMHVPTNYIPIMEDGLGGYYFIVGACIGKERSRQFGKIKYNPTGAPGIVESESSGFFEFIKSRIRLERLA